MKKDVIEVLFRTIMKGAALLCAMVVLVGCGGGKKPISLEEFNSRANNSVKQDLNAEIQSVALLDKVDGEQLIYRLGVGDLLDLSVFRIEELNRQVRVNGRGQLLLPLLGSVGVSGLTLSEAESSIAEKLGKDYIQDPQVSLFVSEYRSQEVTVMGAVKNPNVYSITRSRSVVEMLSLAGGVSDKAADSIRVSTLQPDESTGEKVRKNFVLSINGLLSDREALAGMRLRGGDTIFVPDAGVVYVEGAVEKPGAYKMVGDVSVLQALSLAGGPKWVSNQSKVKVVRDFSGEALAVEINLNRVRDQKEEDLILQDGDIVIVGYGTSKVIASGLFNGVRSIVGFGYSLN